MKNFIKELNKFKETFDNNLAVFLNKKILSAGKVSPEYRDLVKILSKYILAGGKRIRPFLVYLSYKISGGRNKRRAILLGMAVEIFHNFALIHDDIIDMSDLRRNKLTLHKQLALWHRRRKWRGVSAEFGLGLSILAGDILFAWADGLVGALKNEKVSKIYQEMKDEIMIGQAEDIFLSKINKVPSKKRIFQVMLKKSAGYSAQKPLSLGSALAGYEKKYSKLFKNIAKPLGLAFQLKDDILGIFGKREEIGKPTDSDIKEGKITLLIYYTIKSGKISKKRLLGLLGRKNISAADINIFKKLIKSSGALEKVGNEIEMYIAESFSIVERSPLLVERDKKIFMGLAEFLQSRKY